LNEDVFFDLAKFEKKRLTPNLIIIGAQKSGTTSLHNYLDQHPDIFMAKPIKEPGYFCDFEFISNYFRNLPNGANFKSRADILKNYMLQGYSGEQYFGESSLKSFLAQFPREQIYITFFEKLINDPNLILNEVANFLNVEKFSENSTFKKFNVSTNKKQFKKEDLTISKGNYDHLMSKISPDVQLFESLSGLKSDLWNFDEKKWCA